MHCLICTSCLGRDSSHSCPGLARTTLHTGLACTTLHTCLACATLHTCLACATLPTHCCRLPHPCRFATLRKLLCSDSLWGGCEYDVFCAVLKWVGVESARECHLAELLGLIRFPTMTLDQLTAVGKEPRVVACPGFKVGIHVAGAGVWCLHEAARSLPWLQVGTCRIKLCLPVQPGCRPITTARSCVQ